MATTEVSPGEVHTEHAEAPAHSKHRVAGFVSKNRTALVLFLIAIVTGCLAVALFPRRSTVPDPKAFSVSIFTPGKVEDVTVNVAQSGRGRAVMTIGFPVELPARLSQPLSGHVEVDLPGLRQPLHARLNYATPELFAAEATGVIAIPAPDVWVQNQLSLAGELPQFALYAGVTTGTAPTIVFTYSIPQISSYDFSAGPQPRIAQSVGTWTERTQLNSDYNDLEVAETDFAATNHRAEQHDGDYLFLAGALVGLAGGALIGAIQEALSA